LNEGLEQNKAVKGKFFNVVVVQDSEDQKLQK
jgi:hypothetical protein